jgi:hypothetical protein
MASNTRASNSDATPEDVKFISGSKELQSSAKALRAVDFKLPFPDEGPLACSAVESFRVMNTADALSSYITWRTCVP